MIMMFTLARMDILSADDFGIVNGYKLFYKLDVAPKMQKAKLV